MKTNLLLKTASVVASLFVLTACPGPKNDNKLVPSVGPQGHITAFGSENSFCDINNGTIACSFRDPVTQAVCNAPVRSYDQQNLNSFCREIQDLHSASLLPNSCNVSAVTSRILTENCAGLGYNPTNPTNPNNPNNPWNPTHPNNPNLPGVGGRWITCNATNSEGYWATVNLWAGSKSQSAKFDLLAKRGGIKGFFGIPRDLGNIRVTYQPAQGVLPETLTATISYRDRKNKRDLFVKHSGFAGAPLTMNADLNGMGVNISCNENMASRIATNDITNLVCTGNSHIVGTEYQIPIQFIRPLNSIVSGEEVQVSDGVSLSLDKTTSMLTVRTSVDPVYGPSMSSSSSLKADALIEANEGIGFAKFYCTIK